MQLIEAIAEVFRQPPIPYEPAKHSLKAWAKYCLQNRGFKVIYAENADFAIETRNREKLYFNVTVGEESSLENNSQKVDTKVGWIIWQEANQNASVLPPNL